MANRLHGVFLIGVLGLALAGCNESSSDSHTSANAGDSAPTGATPVVPPTAALIGNLPANQSPRIAGSPSTNLVAGSNYAFTPSAADPDRGTLAFQISGKPSWATFNATSGQLSGAPDPSQIGRYENIVISVTDGLASHSLTAFSINVTSPGTGSNAMTLSWVAPTANTDSTPLTNLAGYRVYHGSSADALTNVHQISSPGITSFVFDALATGTHYFAVTAVNSLGLESAFSGVGSRTFQ